jgi:orotate phosphoribosyltransferase
MADTAGGWTAEKRALGATVLRGLYENRLFRTWLRDRPEGWQLVSGIWSPFYLQVRHVPSYPTLLAQAGAGLAALIRNEAPRVNRLVGIASAGVPLATAVGLAMGAPVGYTRKLPGVRTVADLDKATAAEADYGEHAQVEGEMVAGDRLALIDDVVSKFSSKDVALRQIELEVRHRELNDVSANTVVVLIDREQGAVDAARAAGVELLSLVRLRSEGLAMLKGVALPRELEVISSYLDEPLAFQDPARRAELEREAKARR